MKFPHCTSPAIRHIENAVADTKISIVLALESRRGSFSRSIRCFPTQLPSLSIKSSEAELGNKSFWPFCHGETFVSLVRHCVEILREIETHIIPYSYQNTKFSRIPN